MCRQGMCAKWSPNFSDWEGSCTQEGQTSECETKHTCQRVTTPTGGLSIECRDGIYPGSPTGCDPQATNPCTIPDKTCNFDFSDGPVCQEGVWSGISCTADDDPATPDDPCRGLSHTECYLDDDGVKSCHWVAGAGSNMCTGIDGNVDPSFCANVPIPTQVSTQQSAPLSSSASTEKSAAQSPNISAQESAARYRLALDKMEDEESEDLENANDRIDMREFDQITTTNGFGDTNAPVTMYVIQDLKCGVGKGFFAKVIKPLKEEFVSQGVLQIRFIEYPLVRGGDDEGLAKAAICSGQQGSYPQFISYLYHNMGKTSAEESGQYARMLGLNEEKFLKCIESEDTEQILKSHLELVKRLGVTGTPQTVINGKLFPGGQPIEVIRAHIQKLLARKSVS